MNIIELVKTILNQYPRISEICNDIHVDFLDDTATNYGLYPTGDTLLNKDILGNQLRQHSFMLTAVYPSASDYDRLNNSGVLLNLHYWLEQQADGQQITAETDDKIYTGTLTKLTCSNGMLYSIPEESLIKGVQYQLQINAQYQIESEE